MKMNVSPEAPPTLWHALEAAKSEHVHGLTFVSTRGSVHCAWSELANSASELAARLLSASVAPGDVCAIVSAEPQEFVRAFLATICCGAVPMAFAPPALIHDGAAHARHFARTLRGVACRHVFFGATLSPSFSAAVSAQADVCPLPVDAADVEMHTESAPPSPEALCALQLSSGSTGTPRALGVTHRNLIANVLAMHEHLGTQIRHELGVSWLPLWHDMGLLAGLVTPLLACSSEVLIAPQQFAACPRLWLETIHTYGATLSVTSNFGLHLALKRKPRTPDFSLRSLHTLLIGAEPIHAGLAREFQQRFAPHGLAPHVLRPAYGLAEATLAVSISEPSSALKTLHIDRAKLEIEARASLVHPGAESALELVSCGRSVPGHDLAIIQEEGRSLPEGEVGEIAVSGPSITAGAYVEGELEPHDLVGGYLRTGDLGFVYEGELYVTGRKKDLVIIAGRNVSPQLIEWCVDRVPGVREGSVAAFSVPGRETEQLIVLAECESPRTAFLLPARIRHAVASELGLSVVDAVILPAFSLPKTTSGKLQRAAAKRLYLAGELEPLESSAVHA